MLETLQHHPHIGMCNFGKLQDTKHAIDIFKSVVQMGLEGIVIVKTDDKYGALLDDHGNDTCNLFKLYKLKQKNCTVGTRLQNKKNKKKVQKDGEDVLEHEYTIFLKQKNKGGEEFETQITFSDLQDKQDSVSATIKYMERATNVGNTFQHHNGYRHIHFKTL